MHTFVHTGLSLMWANRFRCARSCVIISLKHTVMQLASRLTYSRERIITLNHHTHTHTHIHLLSYSCLCAVSLNRVYITWCKWAQNTHLWKSKFCPLTSSLFLFSCSFPSSVVCKVHFFSYLANISTDTRGNEMEVACVCFGVRISSRVCVQLVCPLHWCSHRHSGFRSHHHHLLHSRNL